MKHLFHAMLAALFFTFSAIAQEVDKGGIPASNLAKSLKTLSNGVAIWDEAEALAALDGKSGAVVWVDTRPKSFFDLGTLKGAILLPYDKKGREPKGSMTKADLENVQTKNPDAKIVIFCQGPECHRSYNACLRAVSEWGFKATQLVWFRAGYPDLLKAIEADPKLARKKTKYLVGSDIE